MANIVIVNGKVYKLVEQANIIVVKGKTYTLAELVNVDIDSWVEGISKLSDEPNVMREAYAMKGWDYPENEADLECPGELEEELTCIANRDKYRFDADGNIVSFEKYRK